MPRTLVTVLSVSFLLLLGGCCAQGLMDEPEPPTQVEVITAEPATPDPHEAVSELEKYLSATQMKSLKTGQDDLKAAATDVQFAAVYRSLKALSTDVGESLNVAHEKSDHTAFPSDLFAEFPFFEVGYEAEGLAAVVYLRYPPMRAAAERTPQKSDDRFLDLVESMYTDASARGWSNIEDRNSDYSGCSPLGHGVHKGILLNADHALVEGDLFAEEIEAVRAPVIKDITIGNEDFFPYCSGSPPAKTLNTKIRGEVNGILAECKLSDSERSQIEGAVNGRFQINIGGGGGGAKPGPRGKRK
jgi:hypothetical protein